MYTAHYNLKIKPFQVSSDVAFMWLGEKHKEALATLRYGILDNKGFLLLTGDVGTGKTTLINTLIASLSNDVIYASVPDPSLEKMDFFNYIAAAFGIGCEFESKGKFLSSFSRFLHKAYENNKKVLLIIDESQLMTQELLEETRLLSNIVTKDSNPLLNIFFVGQYEFNVLIRRPENRAIAQRLTLNYYIEPLTFEETGEYIRHRLKIAGTTEEIFNTSAVKAIYAFSEGFPRKINIICDHCLMSGYAEEKKTITSSIVKDSAKDLQIPERRREQYQGSQITAQRSDQSGPIGQLSKAMKLPFSRSISGFLLIILVLMSFSFLFFYYTKTTYKEATDYLTSIQEKIGFITLEQSGKNIRPEAQSKTVLPDNKTEPKFLAAPAIPLPAKTTSPAQKKGETTSATATLSEKINKLEDIPPSVEKTVEPVTPEPVTVQPLLLSGSTIKDSAAQNPENPNLPLPKETLVIRFKYDSNLFSVSDIERMKKFARVVKMYPEATVKISGYTDSTGDAVYNQRLSEFRASMVKSFLMGQDLPPEQMRAKGFGNQNPVDRNDTAAGRMMNRRVEISVIAQK